MEDQVRVLTDRVLELQRVVEGQQAQIRHLTAEGFAGAVLRLAEETKTRDERRREELKDLPRRQRPRPQLIDTKGLARPGTFDSKESNWKRFALCMGNFVAGVFPKAREALRWCGERVAPITPDQLDGQFGEFGDISMEDHTDFDSQLYTVLMSLVVGEGFDLIVNCPRDSGCEAWRRLVARFDPMTAGRRRGLLKRVLQPGDFPNESLRQAIEQWEQLVKEYEDRRSGTGARQPHEDDLRIGILPEMLRDQSLQDHLYLQPRGTYQEARAAVFQYLEVRVPNRVDDPMDVGSLVKGKGKGKGKGPGNSKEA
jgi:hypothetical protein